METKVLLGAHEVNVYPQRHAYLERRMMKFIQTVGESISPGEAETLSKKGVNTDDLGEMWPLIKDHVYELLTVLLPQYGKRCEKYEFMGFRSQDAYDRDDYSDDVEHDRSPDFPQIKHAITTAIKVNEFDALRILWAVFDPKLLKMELNAYLATWLATKRVETEMDSLTTSATLPAGGDGAATSTTSGAKSPTSTGSEASPGPGSDGSTTGTVSGT